MLAAATVMRRQECREGHRGRTLCTGESRSTGSDLGLIDPLEQQCRAHRRNTSRHCHEPVQDAPKIDRHLTRLALS